MSKDKKKRKKATDATLRNVRASQGRDEKVGARVSALTKRVVELERQVRDMTRALRSIAGQL